MTDIPVIDSRWARLCPRNLTSRRPHPALIRLVVATVILATSLLSLRSAAAATVTISGTPGAAVTINGETVGFLPLEGPLNLAPGTYELRCELTGYAEYAQTVRILSDHDWLRIEARMTRLKRSTAWSSNLLYAGLGQFYLSKKTKGWIFVAAETGGLLTALAAEVRRSDYRKDYLLFKDKYDATINTNNADYYRDLADQAYSDMEDMEKLRNTGLIVAGSAIALSILDALLFFPEVEIGTGEVPTNTGLLDSGPAHFGSRRLATVHAGVKLSF